MSHKRFRKHGEKGSIIFVLLLIVAMFAALGYVVSQSLNMGQGSMDKVSDDKMSLALSETRTIVMDTRLAIQNMVMNGVSVDTIDASSGSFYTWTNTDCGSSVCKLYDPSGGAMKWQAFPIIHPTLTDIPNNTTASPNHPNGLSWTLFAYKGSQKADIIYHIRVNKSFCNYINKSVGVTTDIDSLTAVGATFLYPLSAGMRVSLGSSTAPASAFNGDSSGSSYLVHKDEGCVRTNVAPIGYYYVGYVYAT